MSEDPGTSADSGGGRRHAITVPAIARKAAPLKHYTSAHILTWDFDCLD